MYRTIIYHIFRKSKCYMDISRRVKIGKVIYTAEEKKTTAENIRGGKE